MNKEFISINKDILDNSEFNKLSNITHNGIARLDHSIRDYKFITLAHFHFGRNHH